MKCFAGIDISFFEDTGRTVLDYGSGAGRFSIFLIKKGFFVTALDIDINSKKKILLQLNEDEKKRFKFIHLVGDDSIDNYQNKFDYIICREVLEHIKDYKQTVSLFQSLLNKNGLCIISVPTFYTEKYFSFWDSSWFKKCEHLNVFKSKDIKSLVDSNNLRLEKTTSHSFNRTLFWSIVSPFRVNHKMGKIYNKNKFIKFAEYFSNAVCSFRAINKLGNYIAPKSRVFYLRQNQHES